MKIALLSCDAHPNNGWGIITLGLCNAFFKSGQNFTLFLPSNHTRIKTDWESKIKYSLPNRSLRFSGYNFLSSKFFDLSILSGFDLIHNLFSVSSAFIAARAAQKYDLPFVMGGQGTYAILPFLRNIDDFLFRDVLSKVDHFVTPSNYTRSSMNSFLNNDIFVKNSSVVPNGLDFDKFQRTFESDYKKKGDQFIGVGALKKRKGFDITIKAFRRVVDENPNAHYTIVGKGSNSYTQYLVKLIADLGLHKSVSLKGELTGTHLIDEVSKADIYIHTPISAGWNFEGFGIVYLEANACGLPSIGSRSGGVPSAISDGVSGLLVEEYDILDTSKKMIRLMKDHSFRKKLVPQAVLWAEKHDWSLIAGQFRMIYEKLIKR
jgi:glycosyltransferase involved in cell wall biosynthesis